MAIPSNASSRRAAASRWPLPASSTVRADVQSSNLRLPATSVCERRTHSRRRPTRRNASGPGNRARSVAATRYGGGGTAPPHPNLLPPGEKEPYMLDRIRTGCPSSSDSRSVSAASRAALPSWPGARWRALLGDAVQPLGELGRPGQVRSGGVQLLEPDQRLVVLVRVVDVRPVSPAQPHVCRRSDSIVPIVPAMRHSSYLPPSSDMPSSRTADAPLLKVIPAMQLSSPSPPDA